MVNAEEIFGIDPAMGHPERALALGYAEPASRRPLATLFALDATLAKLARGTREPITAQLRLAWWRDALERLAIAPVAGQPLLAALHPLVASAALDPAALVAIVDGWEALVAGDADAHARDRGRRLFESGARLVGAPDGWMDDAGKGWALADLALTTPDRSLAEAERARALPLLDRALGHRASRAARPFGALALIARMDLDGGAPGRPGRVARLLRYRMIGR